MNKISKYLAAFVLLSFSQHSLSDSNIDVLLVFSDDISMSSFEKSLLAGRYHSVLSDVYDNHNQLDGNFSMEVWPLLFPSMDYTAEFKTSTEALQWMMDENENQASDLRIAREQVGNPGADIIIMVVPNVSNNACGHAGPSPQSGFPDVATVSESEKHAFAVVKLEELNPVCFESVVVPHEVGHLLYAEHEGDLNGSSSLPSPKNHATCWVRISIQAATGS